LTEDLPTPTRPARPAARFERALGRFVIRRYRWCVLLVLAVMAGNVFLRLSSTSISDSYEARYGVSAY